MVRAARDPSPCTCCKTLHDFLHLQVCLELQQTWMESGVSEDAVSGHIQVRDEVMHDHIVPVTSHLHCKCKLEVECPQHR